MGVEGQIPMAQPAKTKESVDAVRVLRRCLRLFSSPAFPACS